jgi:6-phosphogluconolactonase
MPGIERGFVLGWRMIFRLVLLLILAWPARADVETFYLGTYTGDSGSQGIYAGTLDSATGKLGPIRLAAAAQRDPTFLALSPDHRFLFAAMSDAVASFRIERDGTLAAIDRQPSGANTCYVSLDKTGRELFAASYDDGTVSAFPVGADGSIGARTGFVTLTGSGPNADRQKSPHAHSADVDPENHFVYVCDLGSDRIWIFRRGDHGNLIPATPPFVKVGPGIGPRHLVFGGADQFVYVVNELGVSTSVFSRDLVTGALTLLQTEANIEPGWPKGTGSGEIALDQSGKWLYVSTRLTDRMTGFRVKWHNTSGVDVNFLPREQVIACPVKFPRSFALDPSGGWIVVAGQTDNRIAVMKIDAQSGRLSPTNQFAGVGSPVCVLFVPEGSR